MEFTTALGKGLLRANGICKVTEAWRGRKESGESGRVPKERWEQGEDDELEKKCVSAGMGEGSRRIATCSERGGV